MIRYQILVEILSQNFRFQIDLNEMLCIVIASIILTVFIELPFNNLKKVLLDKKRLEQATKSQLDVNSNIKLKDL